MPGERVQYAPDGSSYVTHQMVVEKAYVEELLGAFGEAWERRLSVESAVKASAAYGALGVERAKDLEGSRRISKDPRPSVDPGGEVDDDVNDFNDVDDGDDTGGWRDADDFVRRRRRLALFEAWPEDRRRGNRRTRDGRARSRRGGRAGRMVTHRVRRRRVTHRVPSGVPPSTSRTS